MRCPKYGKFNWWYPKFCRKCGAEFARKKKHRRLLWIIISIVFVLLAGIVFLAISLDKQFNDAVAGIQSNLAEIATAKKGGDFIMAGKKTGAAMDSIQITAITTAKNLAELSVPDELKNYQAAAILWSIRIGAAAEDKKEWEKLKNQPDDFPLLISEAKAYNLFKPIIRSVADLKTSGDSAIANKDREAMLKIGAKLLIEKHWLNAILHSRSDSVAFNPVAAAFAASPSGFEPVPSIKGMDVTCLVCDFPDFYKVRWTNKLRKQYGCEVRCQKETTPEDSATGEQTDIEDQAAKYAETLANYSYDNVSKRTICIGTGGASTGNETTRKYCVEDAVQSTNEIAASAIGFAEGTEDLTLFQWDKEYQEIYFALGTPVENPIQSDTNTSQTGAAPSKPTAEGGHKEGGQGTVQQGEPIAAPEPVKKQGGIWDGYYELSGTCIEHCREGICMLSLEPVQDKISKENTNFYVYNNKSSSTNNTTIGANGYLKVNTLSGYDFYKEYQFTKIPNGISVKMKSYSDVVGLVTTCDYTGSWISADYPEDY